MTRLILASLALAAFILPSYGQDSLQTDRSGYTTGTVGGGTQNITPTGTATRQVGSAVDILVLTATAMAGAGRSGSIRGGVFQTSAWRNGNPLCNRLATP
jgi:hypothetical protein